MTLKEHILESIKTREECQNCPLKDRSVILYETMYEETEDNRADVLFLGINADRREEREGKPFTNPSGKLLREKLEELNFFQEFNVAFSNSIFCSTKYDKEIGDIEESMGRCKSLLREVVLYLRPKIFVPVGKNCAEFLFKIKGPISRISGKKYGTNSNIVPLLHPKNLIYNSTTENINIFNESLKKIKKIIKCAPKDLPRKKKR